MQNPLLKTFDLSPFSKISTAHFLPAIENCILLAKKEISEIINTNEKPTFANTIEAMEYSGALLDRVTSIFFNLNSAETNEEIQKIAQKASPLLSEFSNDISLNIDLFKKIETVYKNKASFDLSVEQQTLLNKRYKSFSRNGANLPQDKKKKLRVIDKELSQLSLKFGENVLSETNAFEMLLTDAHQLSGLPEGAKEAAKSLAEQKGKQGWLITLDYPSYIPFMTYADDRALRKKLSLAFGSKGFKNNEFDNQEIVLKITNLRHQRALLLGYNSHSHYVLEERMAETPDNVFSFLNEILEKAKPAAKKEFEQLESFAKELDGIDQLEKWDSAYYSEKLKQKLFKLDDEQLKPYFKLENVINGVFEIAHKLFRQ